MTVIQTDAGSRSAGVRVRSASTAVTATAIIGTLALLAFAAVNIIFEGTNRFADGPLSDYASGLSIMNWLVVGLKLLGAAVLMRRSR